MSINFNQIIKKMQNLLKDNVDNIAGILSLQFKAVDTIYSIPEPSAEYAILVSAITHAPSTSFLNVAFTQGSGKYSESSNENDNGTVYSQLVTCTSPLDGDSLEDGPGVNHNVVGLLDMMKRRFIVLVQKMDGGRYILGTLENGCKFKFARTTNGAGVGANTYELSFYIDAIEPAPYYE